MEQAVVYARYSSHNQTENSIEGQISAAQQYALQHDYEIIQIYADRAKTGTNDQREAFQQMLADAKHHKFTVIIVWKVDRFGRNREEITFNKYKCKKEGVRVEYVAEQLGTGTESVILESVLEGMAEYYSKQLSVNVRRGQAEAVKKGHWHGGGMRLGYRAEDKKLVIYEPEAEIVRTIFQMYSQGSTMPEIAKATNITLTRVSNALHNRKYIGENNAPRIISDDVWRDVQKRLEGHKRRKTKEEKQQLFILTSHLNCTCGRHMYGTSVQDRMYYVCAGHKQGSGCKMPHLRKIDAEEAVMTALRDELASDGIVEEIVDGVWASYVEFKGSEAPTMALEALRKAEKGIENIMRAVEQGMDYKLVERRLEALTRARDEAMVDVEKEKTRVRFALTKDMVREYLRASRTIKDNKRLLDQYVSTITWDGEIFEIGLNISPDVRINSRLPWHIRAYPNKNIHSRKK